MSVSNISSKKKFILLLFLLTLFSLFISACEKKNNQLTEMFNNIKKENNIYYPKNKDELKLLVKISNIGLDEINVKEITDMSELFKGSKRKSFKGIETWDVSQVVDMERMFKGAKSFTYSLNDWKISENLAENVIFDETTGQKIPWWAYGHKNIGKYKPVELEELKKLVNNEDINLYEIDVTYITDMTGLFQGSSRYNYAGLYIWNVANVESMENMFADAVNFNDDISSWDTSNVKNMAGMFKGAVEFNQDISKWNVSQVENMENMFNGANSFNADISKWNISNVENFKNIFEGAESFNQDLSSWKVPFFSKKYIEKYVK